jgi:copper oxidase (laccase) domain-containing protein
MKGMSSVTVRNIDNTLKVGYSGKLLGNTSDRFSSDGAENLQKFLANFPDKKAYIMPAESKDNIIEIGKMTPEALRATKCDAIVTHNKNHLLVLRAADCMPLVFYEQGGDYLALAHVGTNGAALHLPTKAIKAIARPPESIKCYIGPSITHRAYRFEDHQEIEAKHLDSSWDKYISQEADGYHINLAGYVVDELLGLGIKYDNIYIENVDTGTDKNYFSHRRHNLTGEPEGRNAFAACLL